MRRSRGGWGGHAVFAHVTFLLAADSIVPKRVAEHFGFGFGSRAHGKAAFVHTVESKVVRKAGWFAGVEHSISDHIVDDFAFR